MVEVLVALTVVAVLSGLVSIVFRLGIKAAKTTACTSNLSQIGKALSLYVEDHDGWIPPYYLQDGQHLTGLKYKGKPQDLKAALATYGPTDQMWFCGLDPYAKKSVFEHGFQQDHREMSYFYGAGVGYFSSRSKPFLDLNVSSLVKPASTVYLFEMGWGGDGTYEEAPHGETNNHLYFDGHVKARPVRALVCHFPGQNEGCEE